MPFRIMQELCNKPYDKRKDFPRRRFVARSFCRCPGTHACLEVATAMVLLVECYLQDYGGRDAHVARTKSWEHGRAFGQCRFCAHRWIDRVYARLIMAPYIVLHMLVTNIYTYNMCRMFGFCDLKLTSRLWYLGLGWDTPSDCWLTFDCTWSDMCSRQIAAGSPSCFVGKHKLTWAQVIDVDSMTG